MCAASMRFSTSGTAPWAETVSSCSTYRPTTRASFPSATWACFTSWAPSCATPSRRISRLPGAPRPRPPPLPMAPAATSMEPTSSTTIQPHAGSPMTGPRRPTSSSPSTNRSGSTASCSRNRSRISGSASRALRSMLRSMANGVSCLLEQRWDTSASAGSTRSSRTG